MKYFLMFLPLLILTLVIISISISFLLRSKNTKPASDLSLSNIGPNGYEIPVAATFRGFIGIPVFVIAHNNAFPKIIIYEDHIRFTVIFPFSKKYEDILSVSIFKMLTGENAILITFKDSKLTFSAYLPDRENLKDLIIFLRNKGVAIDTKAEEFLKTKD